MYSVSIIFKNSPTTLGFTFKAFKNAEDLYTKLTVFEDKYVIEDDYGLQAQIYGDDVAGFTFLDMAKEFDKQGEIALLQARAQAKAQNLARSDASLALSKSLVVTNQ